MSVFEATALTLWRDRAACALTFVLPPAIYCVFALIFAGAAGGLDIRLALLAGEDDVSQALAAGLGEAPEISGVLSASSASGLAAMVADGRADAGLEIQRAAADAPPGFVIYENATREAAGLALEKALARLKPATDAGGAALSRTRVNPVNAGASMPAYYAAGVAMLFLLLSGFQTALTLIEERDAGVFERIAASRGGLGAVIDGKFAFIVLQGVAQTAIILVTAAILFGVDLFARPGALALAALAAALAAGGVSLGVTALCGSRAQAHATGVVLTLLLGALGGAMAPAFLMPDRIEAAGALTPVGLGIAAFAPALWAGGGLARAAPALIGLAAFGVAGLILARIAGPRILAREA